MFLATLLMVFVLTLGNSVSVDKRRAGHFDRFKYRIQFRNIGDGRRIDVTASPAVKLVFPLRITLDSSFELLTFD